VPLVVGAFPVDPLLPDPAVFVPPVFVPPVLAPPVAPDVGRAELHAASAEARTIRGRAWRREMAASQSQQAIDWTKKQLIQVGELGVMFQAALSESFAEDVQPKQSSMSCPMSPTVALTPVENRRTIALAGSEIPSSMLRTISELEHIWAVLLPQVFSQKILVAR
jgi:hypothetical protein